MHFQEKEELRLIESRISAVKADIEAERLRQKSLEDGLKVYDEEVVTTARSCDDVSIDNNFTMRVYAENKRKAQQQHGKLAASHCPLPLYNQPADIPLLQDIRSKFANGFKQKLVSMIKGKLEFQLKQENELAKRHDDFQEEWLRAVEEFENDPKRKAKREKTREYFEKVFPELRKQREERERCQRLGARNVTATGFAKSDVDIDQILDNLQEKEEEEKRMRSAACVVPTMLWPADRSRIVNRNGFMRDPNFVYQHSQRGARGKWTERDRAVFREKFAQRPKDFVSIAAALPNKTVSDCVHYYYATKHQQGYKALVKRYPRPRPKTKTLMRVQAASQSSDAGDQKGLEPLQPRRGGNGSQSEKVDRNKNKEENKDEEAVASASEQQDTEDESAESHECHTCGIKLESYNYSRAVDAARSELFGIKKNSEASYNESTPVGSSASENDKKKDKSSASAVASGTNSDGPNARVCHSCWSNVVNSKFFQCPLPTCRTPKRRLARLKVLPAKWPRLAIDVRDNILNEFGIPASGSAQCCANCFQRIRKRISAAMTDATSSGGLIGDDRDGGQSRKMRRRGESETDQSEKMCTTSWLNSVADDAQWSTEEVEELKTALYNNGRNWVAVSEAVGTRTASECRNFYFSRKCDLRLDRLVDLKRKIKAKVANQEREKAAAFLAASCENSSAPKDEENMAPPKPTAAPVKFEKEPAPTSEVVPETTPEPPPKQPEVSVIVRVESQPPPVPEVAPPVAPSLPESKEPPPESKEVEKPKPAVTTEKTSPEAKVSVESPLAKSPSQDSETVPTSAGLPQQAPSATIRDFLAEEIEKQLSCERSSPDTQGLALPQSRANLPVSPLAVTGTVAPGQGVPQDVSSGLRPQAPLAFQLPQQPVVSRSPVLPAPQQPPPVTVKVEEKVVEVKPKEEPRPPLPTQPLSRPQNPITLSVTQPAPPRLIPPAPMGSITHGTPVLPDAPAQPVAAPLPPPPPPPPKPAVSVTQQQPLPFTPVSVASPITAQNLVKEMPKSVPKSVIVSASVASVLERIENEMRFQNQPPVEEKPTPQLQRISRSLSASSSQSQQQLHLQQPPPPPPAPQQQPQPLVSATPPSQTSSENEQRSGSLKALTTRHLMDQLIAENFGGNPSPPQPPKTTPQLPQPPPGHTGPAHSLLLQNIIRAASAGSPSVDMFPQFAGKAVGQQPAQSVAPSPPPLSSQKVAPYGTSLATLKQQVQQIQQQQQQQFQEQQHFQTRPHSQQGQPSTSSQRSFSLSNMPAAIGLSGATSLSSSLSIATPTASLPGSSNAPKPSAPSHPNHPQSSGPVFEPISPASSPSASPQPPSTSLGPPNAPTHMSSSLMSAPTPEVFAPPAHLPISGTSGFAMPVPMAMPVQPPMPSPVQPMPSPNTMSPDILQQQIIQIQYAAAALAAQMAQHQAKGSRSQTPASSTGSSQPAVSSQPQGQLPPHPPPMSPWSAMNVPQPTSSPHNPPMMGLAYPPAPSPLGPGAVHQPPPHLPGGPGSMFMPPMPPSIHQQLSGSVANSGASTPSSSASQPPQNPLAAAMSAFTSQLQHPPTPQVDMAGARPFLFPTPPGVFPMPPLFPPK